MPMYAVVFTMFYPSMEYGRDGVPLDRLSPELQGLLLLILFIFIVLGPVFSFLSLSKSALITGIEMEDKKDRPIQLPWCSYIPRCCIFIKNTKILTACYPLIFMERPCVG